MHPFLKDKILKQIGTSDGIPMVLIFEALGVEDDVQFYERGFSIPADLIKDLEIFRQKLSKISKVGRIFPVTLVGGRIQIDICAVDPNLLNQFSKRNMFFSHQPFLWEPPDLKKLYDANPEKLKELIQFLARKDKRQGDFYSSLFKSMEMAGTHSTLMTRTNKLSKQQ